MVNRSDYIIILDSNLCVVLERRFPGGSKTTHYKRTMVEQYAPYVCDDGLVKKITRFTDFACTDIETVEEEFENRHDKLVKRIVDAKTNLETEHFGAGRDDAIISKLQLQTLITVIMLCNFRTRFLQRQP